MPLALEQTKNPAHPFPKESLRDNLGNPVQTN